MLSRSAVQRSIKIDTTLNRYSIKKKYKYKKYKKSIKNKKSTSELLRYHEDKYKGSLKKFPHLKKIKINN